jgi:hypothetical protein
MVSEQDFVSAFRTYQDVLKDPDARISEARPAVDAHIETLIQSLPRAVQPAARGRIVAQLDQIEEAAKVRAAELAEKLPQLEEESESMDVFATSTRVEGFYPNGNWYPATIAEVHSADSDDVHYILNWDDGDSQNRQQPAANVRRLDAETEPEPEPEPESEPEPEPEPELPPAPPSPEPEPSIGNLVALSEDISQFRLNGEKRRRIEAEGNATFLLDFEIVEINRTMGIGLSDDFRGGQTLIGTVYGIDVAVRLPQALNDEYEVGQSTVLETRVLEYKAVTRHFEFTVV